MELPASPLDYTQRQLDGMTKEQLLELYTANIRTTDFAVGEDTDHRFNVHNKRIFKALRDHADPENVEEHKTSTFLGELNIKINERANTYSRVAKTEAMACIFNCMHLDTLGNVPVDAQWLVPDPLAANGPRLLSIAQFDLGNIDGALLTHLRRFFHGATAFHFYMRFCGPAPAEVASHTAAVLMEDSRTKLLEKIVEIEDVRERLETHLVAYKGKFAKLKGTKLETNADSDHDSSEESDEEPEVELNSDDEPVEQAPKRRKYLDELGTGRDTAQQQIDLFAVDTSRDGGISSLRVRDFKGDLPPHALDLLGSTYKRGVFFEKLPDPRVPEFTSGAETKSDGVTLVEPAKDVEGDTSMTQKLIDTKLRAPYERMLQLRKELKQRIREAGTLLVDNFEFLIDVKLVNGGTQRLLPGNLSATEKYALGMLYMDRISTPKPPAEEEEEGEEDEEEGEEEDSGSEYESSSGESSEEEEEEGDDSDYESDEE